MVFKNGQIWNYNDEIGVHKSLGFPTFELLSISRNNEFAIAWHVRVFTDMKIVRTGTNLAHTIGTCQAGS